MGLNRALIETNRRLVAAVIAAAAAATLIAAGCSAGVDGSSNGKIKVVATTTQLGDIVTQVGGSEADVTQLLHPNSDPHEYEPRPSDVRNTAGAKVVFESGDNLDRWMGEIVKQAGGSPKVVDVGASAPTRLPGETSGAEASKYDPHWRHDPRNVEAAIPAIRDALIEANPDGKAAYTRNATAYLAKVRALDAGIRRCFASVPVAQRKLVTDHDAFGYFARRYGIEVVGAVIPAQTTQAQPSAGELAELADTVKRERVKAVFPESSVNPKLARAIAQQTGASAQYTLYGDTLGPRNSDGPTYLTSELHNADAMVRGFTDGARGCQIAGI